MKQHEIETEELNELDSTAVAKELVREVEKWQLEAKFEDNERYFYHVKEVSQIEDGDKSYVVGRKGSGKTAISEYLARMSRHDVFSEKLSFKTFPFNELYSLANDGYTAPNQYITLWKYVIYSSICRSMARNEKIDGEVKKELEELFGIDRLTLKRRISKWVSKEFSFTLFGVGLKIAKVAPAALDSEDWTQRVDFLEDVIREYIDSSRYYVIFDELDEDYRNIIEAKQHDRYTALITSLFKAVQDVRATFSDEPAINLRPIVFLRDDIYEIIQDSDKNKWNDHKIELGWNRSEIQSLVAFRITRAIDATAKKPLSFPKAWERLLGKEKMRMGSGKSKSISSFDFIARSTYLRPRDFVKYLQACSKLAADGHGRISAGIIRKVDTAFSNYLKEELRDELFAVLPDINAIFDVISHLRKWNFSRAEFEMAYKEQFERGNLTTKDVGFVLQILFLFSVIGNARRHDYFLFRYQNPEARFNFNDRIIVHRGLFKSLQII